MTSQDDSSQKLYCIQRWCTETGHPNEATVIIHAKTKWTLCCDSCVQEWELAYPAARLVNIGPLDQEDEWPDMPALPAQIVIAPISAAHKKEILASGYLEDIASSASVLYCRHGISCRNPATVLVTFCDQAPLPSCDKCARRTWEHHPRNTQLSPLGEYVDWYAEMKQAAFAIPGQVIRNEPAQVAPAYHAAAPEPVPAAPAPRGFFAQLRQAWREYRGWKAQLPADQRLGVEVAETAAAYGAWGAVHHWVKEQGQAAHDSALHIAPMNDVQAGMWRGEERREQARVQHQQNQMAADLHQIASQEGQPGMHVLGPTRRSDIYGNLI